MSFITESKKVYQQVKLNEKIKPYMLSYEKPGSREPMQFADADTLQDLQKQADDLRKKGYVIGKMGKFQPPTQLPKTYLKQDYIINEESDDHEVSMARGELESIADKALKLSRLLKSKSESGNPIEAWVQSKITKAADMINTVHDYMVYNPNMNEEVELDEVKISDIHKMQQNGKSTDEIAKELKLSSSLVKRILGEDREWSAQSNAKLVIESMTDLQIAQLKKEFDPLKNRQISTARANQLSNILDKLDDA